MPGTSWEVIFTCVIYKPRVFFYGNFGVVCSKIQIPEELVMAFIVISFSRMPAVFDFRYPAHTTLLDLRPLPVTALRNEKFQRLYR